MIAPTLARLIPALGRARRGAHLWRRDRPLVWAHRGVSAHATENTVAAFALAAAHGADGVELDVMPCATGEIVVFHDDDLARPADTDTRSEPAPPPATDDWMAVGPAAQEKIERELLKKVTKLERDLMVLKEGGTIQQLIYLNLEGMDQMIREVTFRPDLKDRAYIMEIIEIGPHLDQIKIKTSELKALLALRDDYRSRQNGEGMIAAALIPRIAETEEILNPVFYLASESYTTGITLVADGGLMAKR